MTQEFTSLPKSKAEYVARRLLDRIIASNLKPGSNFGTEAELLEQYDVSRPTLRESLRILEAQGVLELRPGPRGGILVAKPGMDVLAHGLSVYLRLHDVPFLEVLKAREAIEPALAASAAESADEQDLVDMQASIDRMKESKESSDFIAENRTFHSLVARASKNQVISIFWSTISMLAAGDQHGINYTDKHRQYVISAHQQILEAIKSKDAELASVLMREHLDDLEKLLGKRYQNLMRRETEIVQRQGRRIG